jgi:hypothetical protein
MLQNDIIEKILLTMPLHAGSPFRYTRVSKTWYKIINRVQFWQRFMSNVFQDKKLLTSIVNFPHIWKQFSNHTGEHIHNFSIQTRGKFVCCNFLKPTEIRLNQAIDEFIKYQEKNKNDLYLNGSSIFELNESVKICLDIVPIYIHVNNTGFLYASIPRIKTTEKFFNYMIEIEDKLESILKNKGACFQHRIKKANEKYWFNVNLASRGKNGLDCFRRIQLENHPIASIMINQELDFASKYPHQTTLCINAIVSFEFSCMWSSNNTYGLIINDLHIYTFPIDEPQILKQSETMQIFCACNVCKDNNYWEIREQKIFNQHHQYDTDFIG